MLSLILAAASLGIACLGSALLTPPDETRARAACPEAPERQADRLGRPGGYAAARRARRAPTSPARPASSSAALTGSGRATPPKGLSIT